MNIGGYQKLTLIDFPGHIATTVFTVGCSFRCPFCHNPELIVGTGRELSPYKSAEKEFFQFLKKRKGTLDGVCITGGEPTIQKGIVGFLGRIKGMGYHVKLDTNGTRPDVLRRLIRERLIDFVAMDIKNGPQKYDFATATKTDMGRIRLSVEMIMNLRIPYEFRTTAVPGIHTEQDFLEIAEWIKGAKSYWLQRYQEKKILDPNLKSITKNKSLDLEKIKKAISPYFDSVGIRG